MNRGAALVALGLLLVSSFPIQAGVLATAPSTFPVAVYSGGVGLPGATVAFTFVSAGVSGTNTTGAGGIAQIPFRGNGTYDLTASMSCYSTSGPTPYVVNYTSAARTINFTLSPENKLSVSSANSTEGSVSPASAYYAPTASVSETATPTAGYLFDHWLLDGIYSATNNPITVQMNTNHTLAAYFKPSSEPVAVQVVGPSTIPAIVDGSKTTLPPSSPFAWLPGSANTIVFARNVSAGTGASWGLTGMSLNGAPIALGNLSITVPSSQSTYVLTFTKYYLLSVASTDSRVAIKPSTAWYASGTTLTVSAPKNVSLSDGSLLLFRSYGLDGVSGTSLPLQVSMTAPHTLDWVYQDVWPLSLQGVGNDGQSLGSTGYFMVTPPSGPAFKAPAGNTTYLPAGTYGIALFYAGAQANSTTINLAAPKTVTLTVSVGGSAGGFAFHVYGGTLTTFGLQGNNTLQISAHGASGYVRIFVPIGAYYQDFFVVTGQYAASSFDRAQRVEIVNFTGAASFTLEQPPGQVFVLSSQQVVEALNGQSIVSEFSAFEVDQAHIGVNFQSLTSEQGVFQAVPFKPITDPTGTYRLTFGYFDGGVVPVAVEGLGASLTFKEALVTLEYGQVVESSATNAPTGNLVVVPMLMAQSASQSGCSSNMYEVDVLGRPFASMCYVLGTGNVFTIYVFNLQNQYVAGASVTTTNRTVLSITGGSASGSTQTIGIAFTSVNYQASDVALTGTAPVTAKSLPAGAFGPISVAFDPHSPSSANIQCAQGSCSEQASLTGAFDPITIRWAPLPQGTGFNVTVNGVQLIVDGNPSCAAAKNLTASQQPGVDLNLCVQGSPSQGASGDGYFAFTPSRAGQFMVCVSQQSFAGDYSGCQTVYATANGTLGTAGGGAAALAMLLGVAVYARKRHKPRPSIRAQGRS